MISPSSVSFMSYTYPFLVTSRVYHPTLCSHHKWVTRGVIFKNKHAIKLSSPGREQEVCEQNLCRFEIRGMSQKAAALRFWFDMIYQFVQLNFGLIARDELFPLSDSSLCSSLVLLRNSPHRQWCFWPVPTYVCRSLYKITLLPSSFA